jgi:hypothetical protein
VSRFRKPARWICKIGTTGLKPRLRPPFIPVLNSPSSSPTEKTPCPSWECLPKPTSSASCSSPVSHTFQKAPRITRPKPEIRREEAAAILQGPHSHKNRVPHLDEAKACFQDVRSHRSPDAGAGTPPLSPPIRRRNPSPHNPSFQSKPTGRFTIGPAISCVPGAS